MSHVIAATDLQILAQALICAASVPLFDPSSRADVMSYQVYLSLPNPAVRYFAHV